jgi:hypothetical protein
MRAHKHLPAGTTTLLVSLALLLGGSSGARAATFTDTLYFTTFSGAPNLHSVVFTYNSTASTFSLSAVTDIPYVPSSFSGGDGLIFAPDGKTLLLGDQSSKILRVDPSNGNVLQSVSTGSLPVFHLALSPDKSTVYGGGSEVGVAGVSVNPANPLAAGTTHSVTGSDTVITGIAFNNLGNAFYTSSGSGGFGDFGTIDLTTFADVKLDSNLAAAHGILFDPFTNDFILVGSNQIAQFTAAGVLVGTRSISGGSSFDQDSVDGLGHLFIADNNGDLIFIDYSATMNATDPTDPTFIRFLDPALDDIAPLAGSGAPTSTTVPEPGTLALFGLAGVVLGGWRRWRAARARGTS